jgi:phosphoserine phosphatase
MKVVAFDMEGTLFGSFADGDGHEATSLWQEIPRIIGKNAQKDQSKLYDRWVDGEFDSYLDFTRATVDMHDEHGITQEQFDSAIGRARLRDGTHKVFNTLDEYPTKTALVTGSFKELGNMAQRELGIDHVFASCEYFWSDDGTFSHSNILPTDEKGKKRVVSAIAESYGLSSDDVVYVGDNKNDRQVLTWAGTSIGINPPSEIEDTLDYSVNTDTEGFERVGEIVEQLIDGK